MIKVDTEKGIILAEGALRDIGEESLNIIANIYHSIERRDKAAAMFYKKIVKDCIDECFKSEEEIKKDMEKEKQDCIKSIEHINEMIQQLKKIIKEGSKDEDSDFQNDFNEFLYGDKEEN